MGMMWENQAQKEKKKELSVEQCWAHCLIYFWPWSYEPALPCYERWSKLLHADGIYYKEGNHLQVMAST